MSRELSAASQVIVSVIPIVGIVMGCVVVFFYELWIHREKMLMIEKGTYMPNHINLDTFCLLAGILLVGVGLMLTIVFLIVSKISYSLLGGLIPLSLGISLIVFYKLHSSQHHS